jgi:hypothetical protein
LPGAALIQGNSQGFAYGTAAPKAADISALQAGNPNNQAAFAGANTVCVAGLLGSLNLAGSAQTSTSELTIAFTGETQNITIGLLDPTSSGNGFDSLTFTIMEGSATLAQETFDDLADADSYFTDNVLSFSGPATSVTLDLAETSSNQSDGFAVDVEAGTESVPEPSTCAMFVLALGGVLLLARKNRVLLPPR